MNNNNNNIPDDWYGSEDKESCRDGADFGWMEKTILWGLVTIVVFWDFVTRPFRKN
jgi:hypothetical protein